MIPNLRMSLIRHERTTLQRGPRGGRLQKDTEKGGRGPVWRLPPRWREVQGWLWGWRRMLPAEITGKHLETRSLFGVRKKPRIKLRFPAEANWRPAMQRTKWENQEGNLWAGDSVQTTALH